MADLAAIGAARATPLAQNAANGAMTRVDKAARDFEAVFIAQMIAPLFASVETPEIVGGGKSEQFFRSLMQEAYAKAMAERGGFGVADQVKAALIDLQAGKASQPIDQSKSETKQ